MKPRRRLTEREEFGRLLIVLALFVALMVGMLVYGDRGEPAGKSAPTRCTP